MLNYIRSIQKRRTEETGASAVEYGLLVALIAAVIVVAVIALGGLIKDSFGTTCSKISGADGATVTSSSAGCTGGAAPSDSAT